jgi:anthranilate synthase component 1
MTHINLNMVIRTRIDDINTPVSAFIKLNATNSFLLESVSGGENVARYSFIGLNPLKTIEVSSQGKVVIDNQSESDTQDPITLLEEYFNQFNIVAPSDIKLPSFAGGPVGFFAWETIQYIEPITFSKKNNTPFPLMHFIIPQVVIVFDHAKRQMMLIAFEEESKKGSGQVILDEIEAKLSTAIAALPLKPIVKEDAIFKNVHSNYTQDQFESAVKKAQHHIHEGDVFQIVLSQKFSIQSTKKPIDVYRQLRTINPSPYMYFFQFPEYAIIGASPEILTSLSNRKATLRPIAGTRPRTAENEEILIQELLKDPKEIAEHMMLVDLGRNDLGRVCDFNSVHVSELKVIEKYSHVMHIVSTIQGQLSSGKNAFDLFRATFPAGTLSGAPKIRAIQLLEEIEPDTRGPYGGALGYFDFRGNMDLCILIRTILFKNSQYHIQSGAGIVADSIPSTEYQETQNKARGIIQACL